MDFLTTIVGCFLIYAFFYPRKAGHVTGRFIAAVREWLDDDGDE